MSLNTCLQLITAKILSILAEVLDRCNLFTLATTCRYKVLSVDPKCLLAQLHLAEIFLRKKEYKKAAITYKQAVGTQPTLGMVYHVGFNLSRKGNLNDEFFQAMLDVVETPEIASMIKYLIKSPAIYQPSKLWLYYMIYNIFQLETGKIENFKRTVNNNYFNWIGMRNINMQFQILKNELNWSDVDFVNAGMLARFDMNSKPIEFTVMKWKKYTQFLCILWEFTSKKDSLKLLDKLEEPLLGNPVTIEYKGRKVAQDICNSVLEVNTIMEVTKHNPEKKLKVIELGAGHGRVANVLLHAVTNVQVVIIDLPPALYVSQWYLTKLFPKHQIFKFRDFFNYREVQQEFEESSIAFLSPSQIEYLPDKMFDLFINISSLQEMTHAQIEMWFKHIDRVCSKWFYTKQLIESKNDFDKIIICQKDYPVRAHWRELLNRQNPIYPIFFETIYKL